jgi:hypothetical protein
VNMAKAENNGNQQIIYHEKIIMYQWSM